MSLPPVGRYCSSAVSHRGTVRAHNEDSFVDKPELGLWAVADGAGGHQSGDLAARTVAETLAAAPGELAAAELLTDVRLRLEAAHRRLRTEAARRGGRTIIATTVVALLVRDDHFACLWAGDSRAYLLREGRFAQLTRDHSLVQEMVDAGVLNATEALMHPRANVITRAVGAEVAELELDKVTGPLYPGDRFLLCSDGLSKSVPEADLAALLAAAETRAEDFIAAALARHADDNVTAVTVEVVADRSRLDEPTRRGRLSPKG